MSTIAGCLSWRSREKKRSPGDRKRLVQCPVEKRFGRSPKMKNWPLEECSRFAHLLTPNTPFRPPLSSQLASSKLLMDHTHVASSIIFIHIAPLLHTDGLQRWPADNPSPPSLPLRARLRARPTARISYAPASSALVFPISIPKKISFDRERDWSSSNHCCRDKSGSHPSPLFWIPLLGSSEAQVSLDLPSATALDPI
jgi:hypothetical protein